MRSTFLILVLLLAAMPAPAQTLSLGSVEIVQEVGGKRIAFPIDLSFAVQTTSTNVRLSVFTDMSLANLQSNFDGLVKSFPTPRDNCAKYAAGNIVAGVERASLTADGNRAVVRVKAGVAVWDCREGLPSVTVRWKRPCRWCPKIPQFTTHRGSDIKNRLWQDDVDGSFALSLRSPDGKSIELTPSNVEVSPRSDPAKFLNNIAEFFGSGLSVMARQEVQKLVNDGVLRQALPPQLAPYNPAISEASFFTAPDGSLHARVGFVAELTGEQLGDMLREVLTRKP
ncbi:MAG TPA: hypothetical protein VHG28_24075 [Longimicrobiaceae bacterium]|nr:hypothetical protein [Longimicrobiaceae bacterium]